MWQKMWVIMALVGYGVASGPQEGVHLTGVGGPDNFGHFWKDSNEPNWTPPTYRDPSAAGSLLSGQEQTSVLIDLPFPVVFYGDTFQQIHISTEGFASFNTYGLMDGANSAIPSTGTTEPNNAFYVFWDNLDLRYNGRVDTATYGISPNRIFVMEWDSVGRYDPAGPSSGYFTFELQLYESGPDSFAYLYQDLTNTPPTEGDSAKSATVGIENTDGTDGLQYSYNEASLGNGDAIVWSPHYPQGVGGPDDYGHYWVHSDQPGWTPPADLNPSSAGSLLAGEERSYVKIRLPFPVTFYGISYDSLYITTEGFATFNNYGLLDWSNSAIPSTGTTEPNNAFYVFWDDLDLRYNGRVDTATYGSAPERTFVIEWDSVGRYESDVASSGYFTFELQIYEAAGDSFAYVYEVVCNDPATGSDSAKSATVGIENTDGTDGLQYSYDQASLCNGDVILWRAGFPIAVKERETWTEASHLRVLPLGNGRERVSFTLPSPGPVVLRVFDTSGRQVTEMAWGQRTQGTLMVDLDLRNRATGVYLVQLQMPHGVEHAKFFHLR